MKSFLVLIFIIIFHNVIACANDTLTVNERDAKFIAPSNYTLLEDANGTYKIQDVTKSNAFHKNARSLPFIGYNTKAIWLKLSLKNNTSQPFVPITIISSVIDDFDLYYYETGSNHVTHLNANSEQSKLNQFNQGLTYINCIVLPDSSRTVYLRVKSNLNTIIPIRVYSANELFKSTTIQNIAMGGFIGVIIIMAIYNLLLLFIVKDISYLYYVSYIIFLGLSQTLLKGYGSGLLTDDKAMVNDIILPVCRVFFGYSILMFVYEFLHIGQTSRTLRWIYASFFGLYTLPLIAIMLGYTNSAYNLITISASTISVSLIIIGSYLYAKGYKPAKYFMIGWTFFFISILVSIARNQGLINYNNFTGNIILYGSALELVLFSVALADKINFYRRQKNESQTAALAIALENEKLITEQNIALERRVNERTSELIESNENLSRSIENQKAAQMQLVDTEKMASLGQLTAGIAHEINNPINFVSANVEPLRLDFVEVFNLIDKYIAFEQEPFNDELKNTAVQYRQQIDIAYIKEEIRTLLEGIEEGANRTTEIVDSLRTFSRTDDQRLKLADINKAVLNALVILRSTTPTYIAIMPVLNKLPLFNCYPGKIGQVLVNIITNGIQAIKSKPEHFNETISITTNDHNEHITIEITDTGPGISPEVRQRMFEPFFTTKDVGEGTGLGLSIVFGIIEKHQGQIDVQSAPGQGTSFLITLPKNLS